jgi:hypothetical protein
MGKEKQIEEVKVGKTTYVYEVKEPKDIAEALAALISGPSKKLVEIRTVTEKKDC